VQAKSEYQKMLESHEEIEDMMCPICMEQMDVGQIIVITNCTIDADSNIK